MADLLMQSLQKLAKSKEFQQAVNQRVRIGEIKLPKATLDKSAEDYAEAFQDILRECMNEHVMLWGTKLGDDYGELTIEQTTANGINQTVTSLTFDNGQNLSPSLNRAKYGEVILPRLLNQGFETEGGKRARGFWEKHNSTILGISERAPMGFIEEAVERFNEKYGGAAFAEYTPQNAY